ncbi:MAG: hypothetical protein VYC41_05630, partial [Planctomycetota bacterium]|nr:hypothetical protein [Planctomycetota bacterium]
MASLLAGKRTMEFHSAGAGESDALKKAFVGFTTVHWQIPEISPSIGEQTILPTPSVRRNARTEMTRTFTGPERHPEGQSERILANWCALEAP